MGKTALSPADFRSHVKAEDQRRQPRAACNKQIAIFPCASETRWQFRSVSMFDCSINGLGFIAEEPMVSGEQFLAKLKIDKMTLLLYTVRHCTSAGGEYRIGAEFKGVIGSPEGCDPRAVLNALLNAVEPPIAAS